MVLASADVVVVDGNVGVGVDVAAGRGGGGLLNEGCRVLLVYFYDRCDNFLWVLLLLTSW